MSMTPLSKVIEVSFDLKETNTSALGNIGTGKQFNTSDTDAWLSFNLSDNNITGGTYDITLVNMSDKSVFNHTGIAFTTNLFYYKLDSGADELTNEIRHAGKWIGQVVVTLENGDSTTRKFIFNVDEHLLDGTVAQTILLEDYNALIATIDASKDLLTQYNIDYAALLVSIQANVDAFDVALNNGVVATNIAAKLNTLETTYEPRLLSAEQQLEQTSAQVDLLNRGLGATYATLTALQTAYPTGDTKDHIVGADGHRYYWSGSAWADGGAYQAIEILDNTVTPKKTSFIDVILSQNLFDKTTVVSGNLDSGVIYTNATYFVSDFIKIPDSKVITIEYVGSVNQSLCLYDASKAYLAKIIMGGANTKFTYTVTNGSAVYARFSGLQAYVAGTMVVDGSIGPATYVPYSVTNKIKSGIVLPIANLDETIVTQAGVGSAIDSILQPNITTNLFNKYDLGNVDGKLLDTNIEYTNSSFFISYFIKIPTSKIVTIDYVNIFASAPTVHYYDVDKNYLGKMSNTGVTGRAHTFTFSNANAVYFKFNGYRDSSDGFTLYKGLTMVVDGSTLPSFFVEYANILNGGIKTLQGQSFKGKRILFMGDSITVPTDVNGWVNWFCKKVVPSSYVNTAVAGAWWENYADTVLDGNPTGDTPSSNTIPNQVQKVLNNAYPAFDVIIISAGTNNVASGADDIVEPFFTVGSSYTDIATLDLTKTTASIRWSVEKLQIAYPNAQIFLCTPIQSHPSLRGYVGLKVKGDKIKEVATRLAIPYFDNLNCGIYGKNENNGTSGKYLADGLHPNNAGAKLLGEYIARKYVAWYSV